MWGRDVEVTTGGSAVPSLRGLGRLLRRAPVRPTSVVALLGRRGAYEAFRRLVREFVPDAEAAIMAAGQGGAGREAERCWAFLRAMERAYFPVHDLEEYEQVTYDIPIVRNAWSSERFHNVDLRLGELLLFALSAHPYEPGARVALLDAAEARAPRALLRPLLAEIPDEGVPPDVLRERLGGTRYAGAADFADWLWGATGSVFLDVDDDEWLEIEWSRENVLELADEWRRAEAVLDRIDELVAWLEADPVPRFRELLGGALVHDFPSTYEQHRRAYACEITDAGVVPVPGDDDSSHACSSSGAGSLALPLGPPR